MVAVRMVQMAIDQVVNVIAVRHRRVATVGAVFVLLFVAAAFVSRSAAGGIRGIHRQGVFLHLAAVLMVQMAVMQIIDVAFVNDASMSAIGTVFVRVVAVVLRHVIRLLRLG